MIDCIQDPSLIIFMVPLGLACVMALIYFSYLIYNVGIKLGTKMAYNSLLAKFGYRLYSKHPYCIKMQDFKEIQEEIKKELED